MPHPWCFRHSKPAGVPRPDKVRRGSSVPLTRASFQVCDCQYHFARWEDGQQAPLPCFFGAQGPQITRNLLEIEDIFQKYLNMLRAVRGGILDVKNTSWHEDYNRWGAGLLGREQGGRQGGKRRAARAGGKAGQEGAAAQTQGPGWSPPGRRAARWLRQPVPPSGPSPRLTKPAMEPVALSHSGAQTMNAPVPGTGWGGRPWRALGILIWGQGARVVL